MVTARQAGHRHRPYRARPSRLPRLLQTRVSEAVRKVRHLPGQRAGLQQPRRFPSQEGIGPSRCRPRAVPTITGRFAGFQAQWLNVHVDFPLLQRLGLPITIGAVRYPGIKIHERRVIRLSKSSCTAVLRSAAGPPSRSTAPSSPPSTSPTAPTGSTNSATTCASSKPTGCCSVMDPATPTVSPQKRFTSPCSSCSFTNGSAARSPTAAFTTALTPITSRPASSKPPTIAPTKPFNRSSISLPPHLCAAIVEPFVSTILRARIYDALFAAMGAQPGVEDARGRLAYSHNGGRFMVTKPIDGKPATTLNGGTIGF